MRSRIISLMGLLLITCAPGYGARPNPQQALDAVKTGNLRYLSGKTLHFEVSKEKREISASDGQQPVAIVLGCSDSRVPVEMVFDQGLAEVFVVRVAGNICGTGELASIEYGVKYLQIPLIVVLGHSDCGAVKAAVDSAAGGAALPGLLPALVNKIAPAVAVAKRSHPEKRGNELVHAAALANVWLVANEMFSNSTIVKNAVFANRLKIVAAIRDLKSGKVTFLGEYPQPATLVVPGKNR